MNREELVAATTKCWSCLLGQCPGGPHEWADSADIKHAEETGQPDPTSQSCGCACTEGPSLGPEPPDLDEISSDAQPCPVCGSDGACGVDAEGRPMIHTISDEDDE